MASSKFFLFPFGIVPALLFCLPLLPQVATAAPQRPHVDCALETSVNRDGSVSLQCPIDALCPVGETCQYFGNQCACAPAISGGNGGQDQCNGFVAQCNPGDICGCKATLTKEGTISYAVMICDDNCQCNL